MAIRTLIDLIQPFAPARGAPPSQLWPFLFWILRDVRVALWLLLGVTLATTAAEVWLMATVAAAIEEADSIGPAAFIDQAWPVLVTLGLVILLARPLSLVAHAAVTGLVVNPGLQPLVVWRLHRHALGHDLGYFENDFAGRLAQKAMQSGAAVQGAVVDAISAFGHIVVQAGGLVLLMAAADARLAGASAVWIAGYVVLLVVMIPIIRKRARVRAEARAAASGRLVDSYANILTVKLYDGRAREEADARAALTHLRDASISFAWSTFTLRTWLAVLNALFCAGLIGGAFWLWRSGEVGLGVPSVAAMMTLRLWHMSGWIAFTFMNVFAEIGALEDGVATLARPHGMAEPDGAAPRSAAREEAAAGATTPPNPTTAPNPTATPNPTAAPTTATPPNPATPPRPTVPAGAARPAAIAFEDVGFAYGRDERGAGLDAFSLRVGEGEKVALVGPSGAGKTTALALMARLRDVERGRILIAGRDVRETPSSDLRAQIAFVAQDTAMFNRSALDNIRYGRPGATEEEAADAARAASAHAFILDLRDARGRIGYGAHLGERGVKLSGGQRQRIALARAFLKDAPILALDEATAALDSEVEAAIQTALARAARDKTVIAVAHRLSTIARMDRIAVMDAGRVVEEGPHEALLARAGLYARLWERQSGGFLGLAAE